VSYRDNIYEMLRYADFWDYKTGELRLWVGDPDRMQKNDDGVLQALWWSTVIDTEYQQDNSEHISEFTLVEFRPDTFYFGYWTDIIVWHEGGEMPEDEDGNPYYTEYGQEYYTEEYEFDRVVFMKFLSDLLSGKIQKTRDPWMPFRHPWKVGSSSPSRRVRIRDPKLLARWVAELGYEVSRNGLGGDYHGYLPEEAEDLL